MHKFLLFLVLSLSIFVVSAQRFEPEWVGEVVLLNVDADTVAIATDKSVPKFKTGASAGMLLFGIGNVRHKAVVKGPRAATQIAHRDSSMVELIIRCKDNDYDPATFIQIVKFEEKKKDRRAEISNVNWLGTVTEDNMKYIPYKGRRYGHASYLLSFSSMDGEFGVRIVNPEEKDEKLWVFYCFGIHGEGCDE